MPAEMVQLQKNKATFEGNLTLVVFPFLKTCAQETRGNGKGDWRLPVRDCPPWHPTTW
jgi:arginyl-tRNA synthetase